MSDVLPSHFFRWFARVLLGYFKAALFIAYVTINVLFFAAAYQIPAWFWPLTIIIGISSVFIWLRRHDPQHQP